MVSTPEPSGTAKNFAELNALSNYSFLQSASHPEELVQQAATLAYKGLAITDECSLSGVVKAWKAAQHYPMLKLVVGSEFRFGHELFVFLADTQHAYAGLCELITQCRRQAEKGHYHFHPDALSDLAHHGFLLYTPFFLEDASLLNQHLESITQPEWAGQQQEIAATRIEWLKTLFKERLYLLERRHFSSYDWLNQDQIKQLAQRFELPCVASNRALMHRPQRKRLHDSLQAIRLNTPLSQLQGILLPNAENHLRSRQRLTRLFSSSSLENSIKILDQCHFSLDQIRYQYPQSLLPQGISADEHLRYLTYKGAFERYNVAQQQDLPEKIQKLIRKELRLIQELNYACYFLTIHDVVHFARQQGILCQGRGSAANSVVCYCLFITEVDPMQVELLFERFISKRRNEPPDIDVDFENARREEVIQYLYQRYGRNHCAIAATVIRYRPKSAVRDLAKVLDMDLLALENVIANYGWRYRGKNWIDEIVTESLSQNRHTLNCFKELLSELCGFPRHLSQHVGGFILTDNPLSQTVPIENAAMNERTVIQWEKIDLEAVGLMKMDILALGMLSAIQKTLGYISQRNNTPFTLSDIPKDDDPAVYQMLQKGDSVGLFQVESRAQMNMLPRLKPKTYYDLVVQVAIVRPGPIHGDMVHPYLLRKHGKEIVDIPLPELEPVLKRTYGVPIFQEQVIAIAMVAADFSADEAEELRRSMASWKQQGHMSQLREKLTRQLLKKGLGQEYVERLCKQIEGFGEYGFPESHAASFALITYSSAWLKHYYPAEFCCGLLNSQPMGFYKPWQLIQDIKHHRVDVLPICCNHSQWDHQVIQGQLRLGFRLIKGLSQSHIEPLLNARPASGFCDYNDLILRTRLDQATLEKLASANALKTLQLHRHQQFWNASGQGYYTHLFNDLIQQQTAVREPSRLQEIRASYQATGILLEDHPIAYLRDTGVLEGCICASQLMEKKHEEEVFVAGLVINRQRPKTSAGVTFVTLEDETGSINLVVWLKTALQQMETLVKSHLLKVYGKIDKDSNDEVIHLIAYRLFDISPLLKDITPPSRDYH